MMIRGFILASLITLGGQGRIPGPGGAVPVSGPNCSLCAYVQGTNSGNTGVHSDPTSFVSATTAGHTLIAFGFHDHGTGTGTTQVTNAPNAAVWHPCSGTGTGPFTDLYVSGTGTAAEYMSCNYAVNIPGASSDTVTIAATDCAATACSVGGSYIEVSGVATTAAAAWDNWSSIANATSTSGSNNSNCGTASTTQANDLILCGTEQATGATSTAGTSPIAFTLRQPATNVGVESAVWTSSGSMTAAMTDSSSGDKYAGVGLFLK